MRKWVYNKYIKFILNREIRHIYVLRNYSVYGNLFDL